MPDNETILNILPIYSFFDDDVTDNNNSNQTTNTIKGLVIIESTVPLKLLVILISPKLINTWM